MEGQRRSKVARMTSEAEDDDKEDKRKTTRFQKQRHLEESLRYVLNNHVVSENIASYLSLSDMKAAAEVNRLFLQAIRGTKRFVQEAVLAITDDNLEDVTSLIRKTDNKWRGVKVDMTDPTDVLEDLRRVIESAEFVSLQGRPWMNEDRAVKVASAVNLLTAVLSSSPNFSQLKLDIRFLSSNVEGVWSSPAVQQTLRNLNRLELVRMPGLNCHWGYLPRYFNSEEEDAFIMNFGLLTGLPDRLKCFKLTQAIPIQNRILTSVNDSVLGLLRNNRATLEELELHSSVWRIQKLQTLTFSALTILTASVEWDENLCGLGTLGQFLKNQKSLEELSLTSMVWMRQGDTLFSAIKECSVGLKKLHLTARILEQLDWNFLALMNRLKDFQLKMSGCLEQGNRLLASLPKNQLECLSLEELWDTWGTLRGVENEFQFKTELLQGFRCLRKLSFLRSRDAVDDQLMQWLLKEFVSLEEFQLSDCSTLTDAGITGNTTAEWGRDASFADLRRLKTLKIIKCHRVTPNGVLASCENVPSLRSLEYTNPPDQIEESVVMKLMEQNPRLERLSLDYRGDVDDLEKLKAKLLKKNPRVELSLAEK